MKARFSADAHAGFITMEIMLAFALAAVVCAAAMLADRSNAYWIMTAQASSASLPEARANLEAVGTTATQDFFHLESSFVPTDPACTASETCDGVLRTVTDISSCAKFVETRTAHHLIGYPMQTAALSTSLTDPVEAAALGGDCAFSAPSGNWTAPTLRSATDLGSGAPTGIDVLHGTAYVTMDAAPYLRITTAHGRVTFANGFTGTGPYNAIDVTRDGASGRTYAYVAAVSPQLQIIDVTDSANPTPVGSASLSGVALTGTQAQAWRIAVYDRTAYVTTRYMIAPNAELHAFDVSAPSQPVEIGTGYKVSTSVYGIVVHDQLVNGVRRRLAYLATTLPAAELKVLDLTDPTHIVPVTSCDLPGDEQGTAVALLGTTLYVGRDAVPNGEELYAFDASDPTSSTFCTPIGKTDIATDHFSRHVEALRASGPYLFVATTNTTDAHGELQVRDADPSSDLALRGTYAIPGLTETALDFDDNVLYAVSAAGPQLLTLSAP